MPLVGVRYEPSARLVDQARQRKSALCSPTIQTALYRLVPWMGPGQGVWVFGGDSRSRMAAEEDLMRCMDEVGIPFMQSLSTPEAILGALEHKRFPSSEGEFEAAVLRWSTGDRSTGIALLEELATRGARAQPASQPSQYGMAAAKTLQLIGKSP